MIMIVITMIIITIHKHYKLVIMMQAEPAGINACSAKLLAPNKLILSASELMQAICHLGCVISIVWASSACDCASMQSVTSNMQLHCSCLPAAQVLHFCLRCIQHCM